MAKIQTPKIGDIFVISLDDNKKRYFHYIEVDQTELGSDIIRVFKKTYDGHENPELQSVINDEIDFHAHVALEVGIKREVWKKVGNIPDIKSIDLLFRTDSSLNLDKSVPISSQINDKTLEERERRKHHSENWSVWRPNEEYLFVGRLTPKYKNAEPGGVFPPQGILNRLKTGEYKFGTVMSPVIFDDES